MSVAVQYEPKTKKLVLPADAENTEPQLKLEIDQLNILSSEVIGSGADVPPLPGKDSFNQETSKFTRKLYEGGVQAFKMGKFEESVKQFTIGIEMISRRNKFEPFQFTLQELGLFLMSRSDAYLKTLQHLEAFNDADFLIGINMCTPDNFLRRGVANYFMGNYEAARADYQRGLAFDRNNARLQAELEVCLDKILEENGDYL